MLHAIDDDAKAGVDDAELGIEAHRRGEKDRSVGAGAVEEIAVIEIAVGAREGHRLARLVQRIIVAFGQHGPHPVLSCNLTRRSEEHTSELQSLMRISYAVFCLKKKKTYKSANQQQCRYYKNTNPTSFN